MLPSALVQPVIGRQAITRHAHIGRALHVVMTAKDVGTATRFTDIAQHQLQDRRRACLGRPDRRLRQTHAPDQRAGAVFCQHPGHAGRLFGGNARDTLDLFQRPFLNFVTDLIHAPDTGVDVVFIFPASGENLAHKTQHKADIGAGADADIFVGVGRGAGKARIDDDHFAAIFLACQHMQHRHRVRLGGVAADDQDGFGVADVIECIRHRAVAIGVRHPGHGGRMANARLVIDVVGAPKGSELAENIALLVRVFCRP